MVVMRVAKTIFDESIDKAFRLLEQRSLRPGRGNHQYWYLSAACSLVRIQFDPGRAQALEKQATDRVCKLWYKILSLQEESSEEYMAQEVSSSTLSWTSILTLIGSTGRRFFICTYSHSAALRIGSTSSISPR
jgi:hypothetical protein